MGELLGFVVFETLVGIVGEDDFFGTCLEHGQWMQGNECLRATYSTVSAGLCLVESTQSQRADVAGAVVARSDTLVDDWRGADEADLGLDVVAVFCLRYQSQGLSLCLDLLFSGGLGFRIVVVVCAGCPSCPSSGASTTASALTSISIAALGLFRVLTFARCSVSSSASSRAIVPAAID